MNDLDLHNDARNEPLNNRILNLIQGIQPAYADEETLSKLKRVRFIDERHNITFDE